ncbi:hypothetical protein T484DRAFT_1807790 [Baffinella frigidus]|nr:hypothetical protein T484DRAFT_1807790 [Cryptophyta sp. CCMP2293]
MVAELARMQGEVAQTQRAVEASDRLASQSHAERQRAEEATRAAERRAQVVDGDRKRLLAKNKELQRLLDIAKSEFLAGEGPASASLFDSFAGQTGGMGASFAGHTGGAGASFLGQTGGGGASFLGKTGGALGVSSRFNGVFNGVAQVADLELTVRELELFSEELARDKAEGDRYATELLERNGNLEKEKRLAEEEAGELAAALRLVNARVTGHADAEANCPRARELALGSMETISDSSERLSRHNDALQRQRQV